MVLSARMPDLMALEVLLAVARTGSLSAAGREIGLTQQAVSARMAALEAQTGVRLAVRTTRGADLTPAGVVVAQWADRLVRVAQEVDAGLASLREDTRSRIRVSASLTVAEQLLPSWLVSLRADTHRRGQTPVQVVLEATNSDHVIEQVRSGCADLGFVEGPGVPRGLGSRIVAHDELVLVVPPDHRWARRASRIEADELCETPLVTREVGSGTRESLATALRQVLGGTRRQAPPALELSTTAAVRAAVLAGAGPAVISRLAVGDDLRSGRLRQVALAGLDLHRELRAVWTGGRTPPAGAVRTLLTHIGALAAHD
ncbi:LysR family transcriptional regulator [Micromonospora sp. NBC_01655]|uniref:LysR family transcriptional regulator n=1 Tax=Micromonospora sp. NBC_01655 TaxID=2975983 RepID=UPI00225001DE|nr:LysR family transcriptional regulator [Micromonospora sp. NBC_01655]MCX4469478.1 LysR family transcriptional regulator [Micromonospora sp. NBC_01655]